MNPTETFKREISFFNPAQFLDGKHTGGGVDTKTFTFKELSRIDRDQHELHFTMMTAFETRGRKSKIDPGQMLELTDLFINTCFVLVDGITETDKTLLLNDSIAKLKFGTFLLNEKMPPFFQQLVS
jgi:hypothetical protein